jgi:hypothetical protein
MFFTSRRNFLRRLAAAVLAGSGSGRAFAAGAPPRIAARDAANVAAGRAAAARAVNYTPITADIVHFLSYGQSLDLGELGTPVLSTTQPFDNLMLGASNRAKKNSSRVGEVTTTWLPLDEKAFEPLVASTNGVVTPPNQGQGESPSVAALNYLRNQWLLAHGETATSSKPAPNRFVLTTCGIGKQTVADLLDGADPDIFNRVTNAVNQVRSTAKANGQTYQFAGVFYTQGETDAHDGTPYETAKANLQLLQSQVASTVSSITGAPCVVPWVIHQPATAGPYDNQVHQAWLDLATTPGSNFYCAGPVGQYPANKGGVHRTANGYRWFGSQYGKVMSRLLVEQLTWLPCYVTGAVADGNSVLVDLHVPAGSIGIGTAYTYAAGPKGPQEPIVYDNLGLTISDDAGVVPILLAEIAGAATLSLTLGRELSTNPVLYSGYSPGAPTALGTNLCDGDTTKGFDEYVYGLPGQSPTENIAAWNGAPLVGAPYPLNNYLAIGFIAIAASG